MDAEREKMLADAWARAEDEITRLRQQVATLTEQRDLAVEALEEMTTRIKDHPAYEELSEYDECEVGGDTAEFSYLGRLGDSAIAAIQSSKSEVK